MALTVKQLWQYVINSDVGLNTPIVIKVGEAEVTLDEDSIELSNEGDNLIITAE